MLGKVIPSDSTAAPSSRSRQWIWVVAVPICIVIVLVVMNCVSSRPNPSKRMSTSADAPTSTTPPPTDTRISVTMPLSVWSSIGTFVKSPASGENYFGPVNFILSSTCAYGFYTGADPHVLAKTSNGVTRLVITFTPSEVKEWDHDLSSNYCIATTVRQDFKKNVSAARMSRTVAIAESRYKPPTTTTTVILSWSAWVPQLDASVADLQSAIQSCAFGTTGGDASDLLSLARDAPDTWGAGVMYSDVLNLSTDAQGLANSWDSCQDIQNSFSDDLHTLNQDLSAAGQPTI